MAYRVKVYIFENANDKNKKKGKFNWYLNIAACISTIVGNLLKASLQTRFAKYVICKDWSRPKYAVDLPPSSSLCISLSLSCSTETCKCEIIESWRRIRRVGGVGRSQVMSSYEFLLLLCFSSESYAVVLVNKRNADVLFKLNKWNVKDFFLLVYMI